MLIIQTGVSGVGQQVIKPLMYMPGRAGIMVVVCDYKGYDFCSNFCTVGRTALFTCENDKEMCLKQFKRT